MEIEMTFDAEALNAVTAPRYDLDGPFSTILEAIEALVEFKERGAISEADCPQIEYRGGETRGLYITALYPEGLIEN
jgi:hypothetical protein